MCMVLYEIQGWIKLVYALVSTYKTKPKITENWTGLTTGSQSPLSPLGQTKVLRGKVGPGKEGEAGREKASNYIRKQGVGVGPNIARSSL